MIVYYIHSSEPLSISGSIPTSIQGLTSSSYPAKFICFGKVRFKMDFFEIKCGDKRATCETGIFEESGTTNYLYFHTQSEFFLLGIICSIKNQSLLVH